MKLWHFYAFIVVFALVIAAGVVFVIIAPDHAVTWPTSGGT